MSEQKMVRIGNAMGFWGDDRLAPKKMIASGEIDYLTMDFMSEITMSICQKQKEKNPDMGFAHDITMIMDMIIKDAKEKNIKIITNAGGVNPVACGKAIAEVAKKKNISYKIATIVGDDLMDRIDDLINRGVELKNIETGDPLSKIRKQVTSANVYTGVDSIVDALKDGADIVITGRCADPSMTLAPAIVELGWDTKDYDKMTAGTIAGHIIECGPQSTGGNFPYADVPDLANVGFPIAQIYENGDVIITKPNGTGGMVTVHTVTMQLLYELGDPQYKSPDCTADFTSFSIEQEDQDRVKLSGFKGYPPPEDYKVSISYFEGTRANISLGFSWPDALKHAKSTANILLEKAKNMGIVIPEKDINISYGGVNATHPMDAPEEDDPEEVILRIGLRSKNDFLLKAFLSNVPSMITSGTGATTAFLAGGSPKSAFSTMIAFWGALVPRSEITTEYKMEVV
jgi:hypothetical protein